MRNGSAEGRRRTERPFGRRWPGYSLTRWSLACWLAWAGFAWCSLDGSSVRGWAGQANQGEGAQLPAELRGAKVFHLPEGLNSRKAGGNPIIMKKLAYQDINLERLTLNLFLAIKPVDRAATVTKVYYEDVRVNNVPVHIAPYDQEFKLSTREAIDLPAPLEVSFVFSDLDSLAPIRDLLAQSALHVTGHSFLVVKLSRLERLALWSQQMVVPVDFDEQVPADLFPGQSLLGSGLVSILTTLSNPFSSAAGALARERQDKAETARSLEAIGQHSVCLLYCEYVLRDPKTHKAQTLSQYGTGIVIGSSGKNWRILTAKRVIEPWKFEPPVAFLMQHENLELDRSGYRLALWPSGSTVMNADGGPDFATALGKSPGTLNLARAATDQLESAEYQDPDSGARATLSLAAAGSNDLAVLDLSGGSLEPVDLTGATDQAASPPGTSGPLQATLLGFPFALSQMTAKPQAAPVQVTAGGGAGRLLKVNHSLNPGEAGAPLVDRDGRILAICGDTSECIPIQTAIEIIKQVAP